MYKDKALKEIEMQSIKKIHSYNYLEMKGKIERFFPQFKIKGRPLIGILSQVICEDKDGQQFIIVIINFSCQCQQAEDKINQIIKIDHPNLSKFQMIKMDIEKKDVYIKIQHCNNIQDINFQELNLRQKLKIMVQLAQCVNELHSRKIYLNLKPTHLYFYKRIPQIKFCNYDFIQLSTQQLQAKFENDIESLGIIFLCIINDRKLYQNLSYTSGSIQNTANDIVNLDIKIMILQMIVSKKDEKPNINNVLRYLDRIQLKINNQFSLTIESLYQKLSHQFYESDIMIKDQCQLLYEEIKQQSKLQNPVALYILARMNQKGIIQKQNQFIAYDNYLKAFNKGQKYSAYNLYKLQYYDDQKIYYLNKALQVKDERARQQKQILSFNGQLGFQKNQDKAIQNIQKIKDKERFLIEWLIKMYLQRNNLKKAHKQLAQSLAYGIQYNLQYFTKYFMNENQELALKYNNKHMKYLYNFKQNQYYGHLIILSAQIYKIQQQQLQLSQYQQKSQLLCNKIKQQLKKALPYKTYQLEALFLLCHYFTQQQSQYYIQFQQKAITLQNNRFNHIKYFYTWISQGNTFQEDQIKDCIKYGKLALDLDETFANYILAYTVINQEQYKDMNYNLGYMYYYNLYQKSIQTQRYYSSYMNSYSFDGQNSQ